MLITTPWLLQYLDAPITHDALMEAFPKVGLEIEESKPLNPGAGFKVDLNVLANRPDCLGIIGVAREIAAHFDIKLKYPKFDEAIAKSAGAAPVQIEIRDPDLCPRYIGRVMTGVKVAPSPKWLQDILISIDQRSINNIVDITNFVMMEFGQPLHAFDFANIGGKIIVVRRMQPGEKLELLGGKTIDAGAANASPTLVIADAEKPVALAGIMGGKLSETRDSSAEILMEAAHFDPPTIRKTAKRIDVSTESSYRFERGCDPNCMLEGAMNRACSLIAELAGGKPAGASVDAYPNRKEPRVFKLTSQRVSSYLGADVDANTIKSSLTKLQMTVADDLTVTVPTWRIDAVDPVVLIEDVARLVGYDTLPMRPTMQTPTLGKRSEMDQLRQELARYLSSVGYLESRTPSLDAPEAVDPMIDDPAKSTVRLKNPMTREASVMRTSLLPSLVRVAEGNTRRGATTTRFFEQDKVYRKRPNAANEPGAIESWRASGVAGGLLNESDWSGRNPQIGFFDVKGVLEDILEIAGARDAVFESSPRAGFTNDTSAAIKSAGQTLGHIGQIDSKVIPTGKMTFPLFGFELDVAALLTTHATVAAYKQLARTPEVWRDLAIVVKADESYANIDRAIRESAGATLESMRLVDLYRGKQIATDEKSLAFRLVFRDPTRTLTAEEVNAQVDRIVAALKQQFNATLRV
ncbi:MAG: phenylalanine--tRNA ligase subunit beta [Anaerolineae bacterium]|nr:phenylalanine--tRNA ligase subunit beta [Phycisphaerae bacterium]